MDMSVEKKPFICLTCGDCYPLLSDFNNHMLTHSHAPGQGQFVTPNDMEADVKYFPNPLELDGDMKIHTEETSASSRYNPGMTNMEALSVSHERHMNLADDYEKSFDKESAIDRHVKYHQKDKPYKCFVCEKSFAHPSELKEHVTLHVEGTGIKSYTCEYCGESFESSKDYQTHCKREHPEENDQYHELGETEDIKTDLNNFPSNSGLNKCPTDTEDTSDSCHLKDENVASQISAPDDFESDGKSFPLISESDNQTNFMTENEASRMSSETEDNGVDDFPDLDAAMGENDDKYTCNICGKSYKNKGPMEIHKLYHTNERPFKCTKCDRSYMYPSDLRRHILVHNRKKLPQTYKPIRKGKLIAHNLIHKREKVSKFTRNRTKVLKDGEKKNKPSKGNKFKTAKKQLSDGEKKIEKLKGNKCKVCGKCFELKQVLKKHMISHSSVKPYKCFVCGKSFHFETSLRRHLVTHPGMKPFMCGFCEDFFSSRTDLKNHMIEEHPGENLERPHRCKKCGRGFKFRGSLRNHSLSSCGAEKEKGETDEENDVSSDEKTADDVTKSQQGSDDFTIDLSVKKVAHKNETRKKKTRKNYSRHSPTDLADSYLIGACKDQTAFKNIPNPLGIKCNICPVCGKTFLLPTELNEHFVTHTGDTPYKCMVCGERFRLQNEFKKHISRQHPGVQPYECEICKKTYNSTSNLRKHMKSHLLSDSEKKKEKTHLCDTCGKAFADKTGLKQHRLIHSDVKANQCVHCGKFYRREKEMKRHIISVHTDHKPFQCQTCGKKFAYGSMLKKHVVGHSDERPHICSICGKSYLRRASLKEHQMVHTGVKPFRCQMCGKGFLCSSHVKRHLRQVHGQNNEGVSKQFTSAKQISQISENVTESSSWKNPTLTEMERDSLRMFNVRQPNQAGNAYFKPNTEEHRINEQNSQFNSSYSFQNNSMNTHHGQNTFTSTKWRYEREEYPQFPMILNQYPIVQNEKESFQNSSDQVNGNNATQQSKDCEKSLSKSPETEVKKPPVEVKSHICPICGKGFVLPSDLNDHFVTHTDETPYECTVCGEHFRLQNLFKKHMSQQHPGVQPYKCEICNKSYNSTANLRKHMKSHLEPDTGKEKEKTHLCDTCGKAFADKTGLKQHRLIHSDEKTNQCVHCGKFYRREAEMKRHIVSVHTDHKPYQCQMCGKKFAYESMLKKHMVGHSDVRPHICSICGKSYLRRDALKSHQMVHTGVKPYKCQICGKGFLCTSHVKRHLRQVHGQNNENTAMQYDKSAKQTSDAVMENPGSRVYYHQMT